MRAISAYVSKWKITAQNASSAHKNARSAVVLRAPVAEERYVESVSAQEVASIYEQNQVAGDQRYYGKKLRVTGVVASIGSGLGNEPYITFSRNQ